MYDINALGPVRVLAAAAPLLHKGSVVLNVTSEAGSVGDCKRESEYGYCMSKAAENMASKIFSNEYRARGVRVVLANGRISPRAAEQVFHHPGGKRRGAGRNCDPSGGNPHRCDVYGL
jgi:NAD(P)-dependent dehydrogenase (short-subunit alcohol dehydrogenase family)